MKVSICCITYNHEQFIGQTIQGFSNQKVDFDIELIIYNDASTDTTKEIIDRYAAIYPNLIKAIHHDTNVGMMENFIQALHACTGDYISFCEGDDYWSSPEKLKLQASFLDNNPTYMGVCHNVQVLLPDGSFKQYDTIFNDNVITAAALMATVPVAAIPTCSLMIRKEAVGDLTWVRNMPFADIPLWINVTAKGPIFGMKETLGVYRKHELSYTATFDWNGFEVGFIKFYNEALKRVDAPTQSIIMYKKFQVYQQTGSHFLGYLNFKRGWQSYLRMVRNFFPQVFLHKETWTFTAKILFYPIYYLVKKPFHKPYAHYPKHK